MASVVLWLDSWLRGEVGSDDLLDHLAWSAPDAPTTVSVDFGRQTWTWPALLSELRTSQDPRTWLLLPRPGRTVGWPHGVPGAPTSAALLSRSAAEDVLLRLDQWGWRWDACDSRGVGALEADMLTARAGARALAQIATVATERLEALGLDRPARLAPQSHWRRAVDRAPGTLDPQMASLLARLGALLDALEVAAKEDGAAVTAGEARARTAELQALICDVEQLLASVVNGVHVPRNQALDTAPRLR